MVLSAVIAAVPLAVLLILMGGLRKSGYVSAAWGLGASMLLAVTVWRMPLRIAV
jgi:lactate permease